MSQDEVANNKNGGSSNTSSSSHPTKSQKETNASASFTSLFQFATQKDVAVFCLGIVFCILSAATFPAINIIFGDVIDAIAEPISVGTLVNRAVRAMAVLALYGFVTFFGSFLCCGYAASNIANGWRMRYLETLLVQDMSFFDEAEPGSLTLMLSDSATTIQAGLSDKLAQGVQGIFQFVFGFVIAFYFGAKLTAVLLACVPVLGLITTLMFMWGEEDGIFGKAAYEEASTIANEAMSNVRTVASLNAEPTMSQRYDAKLSHSEQAAIRQGTRSGFLTGALFFVIFAMYGLGFWYGSTLIADSIDAAMRAHPPPDNLLDPDSPWYPIIQIGCANYLAIENEQDATTLEVCACGLPWGVIDDTIESPNCGCGYAQDAGEDLGADVLSGCVSGGRIMMVFFSILIGAFSAGQVGPGVKAIADARSAAAKMLSVIERVPEIGGDDDKDENASNSGMDPVKPKKKRLTRDDVAGEITLENVHFQYKSTIKSLNSENGDETSSEDQPIPSSVVFSGCDLTIKAGETVALVSRSKSNETRIFAPWLQSDRLTFVSTS